MKKIFWLSLTLVISLSVIGKLYLDTRNVSHQFGEFYRLFTPHPFDSTGTIELPGDAYYLAGNNGQQLFVGVTGKKYLLSFIRSRQSIDTLAFGLPDSVSLSSCRLLVKSGYLFLLNYNDSLILTARFTPQGLSPWHRVPAPFFTLAVPITGDQLLLRTFNQQLNKNTLTLLSNGNQTEYTNLLEKSIDGYFDSDGSATYDDRTGHIIYVYRYCHTVLLLDQTITAFRKTTTIDSTAVPHFEIGSYQNGLQITTTFSKPPIAVNKWTTADNGSFWVLSNVMSRSEKTDVFNRSELIDLYSEADGRYRFSIDLPKTRDPVLGLLVAGGYLYVLTQTSLRYWQLTFE